MYSARELKSSAAPAERAEGGNRGVLFAHGNGAVPVAPGGREGTEGLRCSIYVICSRFGRRRAGSASRASLRPDRQLRIVKGSAPELETPKGKDNIYADYDGTGGVPVGGIARKILLRLGSQNNVNLLLSSYIIGDSRDNAPPRHSGPGTDHRPLVPAPRPRPLSGDQRRAAVLDASAYTTSDWFPYAQPTQGLDLNYIRNSVKASSTPSNGTVPI